MDRLINIQISQQQFVWTVLIASAVMLLGVFCLLVFMLHHSQSKKLASEMLLRRELEVRVQLTDKKLEETEGILQLVAREVHDHVGHDVAFISRIIKDIMGGFSSGPTLEDRLGTAKTLTERSLRNIRLISRLLQGEALLSKGLPHSIREEARLYHGSDAFEIHVDIPDDFEPQIDPAVAKQLFRIFQECISNCIRYSNAKEVHIILKESRGFLELAVVDDGDGFDQSEKTPTGLGMIHMKDRAEKIGASIHVESSPGMGTRVSVRLPYPDQNLEGGDAA